MWRNRTDLDDGAQHVVIHDEKEWRRRDRHNNALMAGMLGGIIFPAGLLWFAWLGITRGQPFVAYLAIPTAIILALVAGIPTVYRTLKSLF